MDANRIKQLMAHAGAWRVGTSDGAVVSDAPTGHDDCGGIAYYGGHLVAESIPQQFRPLIAAAPELLAVVQMCLTYFDECICDPGMQEIKKAGLAAIAKATTVAEPKAGPSPEELDPDWIPY